MCEVAGGACNEIEGVHAATPFCQFVCLLVAWNTLVGWGPRPLDEVGSIT